MTARTDAPLTAAPVTPVTPSVSHRATELRESRPPRAVRPRHRLEYGALRLITGALGMLGFRRASALGGFLGRLGYSPFGIRRDVVERQIAAAFPDWSPDRVRATALGAYDNLGRTTIETALLPDYGRENIVALFRPTADWHVMEEALSRGRGVIVVAGHLGNWELGGAYLAARGVDFEAVARQMENPLVDAYVSRTRRKAGMKIIYDGDAVRRVPRALRDNAVVAFLMDQGAAGLASTWVPFFGRQAKTPRGAAVFALRLRAPILFVVPIRNDDGGYTLSIEEVPYRDTGNLDADVDRIVADCTATLERWVRRAPAQYFWHHRRWKHQQANTPTHLGDPLK